MYYLKSCVASWEKGKKLCCMMGNFKGGHTSVQATMDTIIGWQ